MKLIVGSKNQTKVQAVADVFTKATVIGADVPSDVAAQPFGDEETLQGALNRAKHAQELERHVFGVGLEGGVILTLGKLYVCNWGTLLTPEGNVYHASGARVRLPDAFIEPLKNGTELSELMNAYTKRHNIRHHEGAIGIFTNGLLKRQEMFAQVVTLLYGQYLHEKA